MKFARQNGASARWQNTSRGRSSPAQLLVAACVLILLIGIFRARRQYPSDAGEQTRNRSSKEVAAGSTAAAELRRIPRRASSASLAAGPTAQEIVAAKLTQFAQSRRGLVYALAKRHHEQVSSEVERFFDAVESGDWDRIEAAFKVINGADSSAGQSDKRPPGTAHLWPAIIDAYGAAEQVHEWPAQKLLDYGNAILDSLRPGMVYVGGTDSGRWIPELLNETSGGERHIILTQNGLADGTYLDYLRLQYEDHFSTLTAQDSARAFSDYIADAQKRLEHDQQFPDEPKHLRPGENVKMSTGPLESGLSDGQVQVSGQVAVMAINERLLQILMAQNPSLTFALQESFPLKGTYADAVPLGPLMELRAENAQTSFNAERAAQSLSYWQSAAQQLFGDAEISGSSEVLKSYSHDTVSAANLLASHQFGAEAEQLYRLAMQLWPENPESVGGLADLLAQSGRQNEARQVLEDYAAQYPNQKKDLEKISATFRLIAPAPKRN